MNRRKLSLLFTGLVMLLAFSVTLNSCKDSGGITDSDDPDDPTPTPTEITSSFESEDTSFLPGQVQFINVEGTILDKNKYSAQLDSGTEVLLYRDSNDSKQTMLYMFIPLEPVETYTLEFILQEQKQSLTFSIAAYELVEDPEQYMQSEIETVEMQWEEYTTYLDSMVTYGNLDAEINQQDLRVWDNINQQAAQEWEGMDESQKEWVVTLIEANKPWLEQLDAFSTSGYMLAKRTAKAQQGMECQDIYNEGKKNQKANKIYVAAFNALEYKWCRVDLLEEIFSKEFSKKARVLWAATDDQYFQNTITNLLGRKIDKFSKWFSETSNSTFVADKFEEVREKIATVNFPNGDNKSISARIQFRSLMEQDATYTDFAALFSEYISFYDLFATNMKEELVWRPSFRSKTVTVDFNRFLSVDKESISNNKVILLNTQMNGDEWEVAFATDEDADQQFTFDLVYDDGRTRLTKQIAAVVNTNKFVALEMNIDVEPEGSIQDTLRGINTEGFRIVEQPQYGSVFLVDAATGIFTYTPPDEFVLADRFTFSALNEGIESEPAEVAVTITHPCDINERVLPELILNCYEDESKTDLVFDEHFFLTGSVSEFGKEAEFSRMDVKGHDSNIVYIHYWIQGFFTMDLGITGLGSRNEWRKVMKGASNQYDDWEKFAIYFYETGSFSKSTYHTTHTYSGNGEEALNEQFSCSWFMDGGFNYGNHRIQHYDAGGNIKEKSNENFDSELKCKDEEGLSGFKYHMEDLTLFKYMKLVYGGIPEVE